MGCPFEGQPRMVRWFRARRITGMSASTLKALRDLDSGAHWALAGTKGPGKSLVLGSAPLKSRGI